MKKNPQVLIVGAGPTGLMMAAQLSRFGISYRIIEKSPGPTTQSRAIAVQARSIEILQQMGLAEKAIAQGYPTTGVNYVAHDRIKQHISFGGVDSHITRFPYVLILEQSKTEQLLLEYLEPYHPPISWDTELLSFSQTETGITAQIKTKSGKEEVIEAEWLIGADGAKSPIRHLLEIPFAGKTYKQSLFVLDCKVTWRFTRREAYIVFSENAFAALFPLINGRYRIVGVLPPEMVGKETITYEDITKDFAKRMKVSITFSDPKWYAVYHSHHRCVASFRKGRCFLVGDAAHIHSPLGGQGMNTGLQDAYNLSWKLAYVLQNNANEQLLDTYTEERLPVAKRLVETTDRAFNFAVNNDIASQLLRLDIFPWVIGHLIKRKFFKRFVFSVVSQLAINYRSSVLSREAVSGKFLSNAPRPGDRLPYALYEENHERKNIQDLMTGTSFHLLVFPGLEEKLPADLFNALNNTCISITTLPLQKHAPELYQRFGIPNQGVYLIRPDMYIAYRSNSLDITSLTAYLSALFR